MESANKDEDAMRTAFRINASFASWIALGVVVGVMVLQPGESTLGAATSTIYACVTPSGSPRVISTSPIKCHPSETLITWNQQGSGPERLQVVDSLGHVVGPLIGASVVGIQAGEEWVSIVVHETEFITSDTALYETTDCSGIGYLPANNIPTPGFVRNGILYSLAGPHQTRTIRSRADFGICFTYASQEFVGAITPLADVSSFVPPFRVQSQ
jgi:hypothetical protein